jgi:hypothetical protein
VTTWGNQFIASTSIAIGAQRLYQNNGRHFREVRGNQRVGSDSWQRRNYGTMAKSFGLLIKDVSCRSRRIRVNHSLCAVFRVFPLDSAASAALRSDLRGSVLMALQRQTQTKIRNSFGVADDRLVARFPIVLRRKQRNQRQDNEQSRH